MSGSPESHVPSNGQFARWARLTLKELRESLRDRRTIITLVLMPILVYPLLGVAFNKYLLTTLKPKPDAAGFKIGVENEQQKEIIQFYLVMGEAALENERAAHDRHVAALRGRPKPVPPGGGFVLRPDEVDSRFQIEVSEDLEAAVASGKIDLGIRVPREMANRKSRKFTNPSVEIPFEFVQAKSSPLSARAAANAELVMNSLNEYVRMARLIRSNVPRHDVPAHPVVKLVEPTAGGAPFSLGRWFL